MHHKIKTGADDEAEKMRTLAQVSHQGLSGGEQRTILLSLL